ncbi:MAG: shikimate dehydrogenase [Oscillospiraceae bacterium]|nr:shikimate dehydrogenase [Oscillospiraceae bacterium]
MQYGCIGEHLTHSFSREIHEQIADYLYALKEIPMGELDSFMTERAFKAINVTIPYKQDVIPHLSYIDPIASKIGAVNTIVNRNGELFGYNTDFGGMESMIQNLGISLMNKKVLIFGTGGTSKTAAAVSEHLGASAIYKVSRSPRSGVLTYEDVLSFHTDAEILINTTPKGMYSREKGMPVDPKLFKKLEGVVDAVYNPLRTEFVRTALEMGVPAVGGLYMLVCQAVLASEIFLDTKYPAELTEDIYHKILGSKENIVLTGMPGSGKSTVGKLLAEKMQRPYYDTDTLITEKTGKTPAELIVSLGESAFRIIESEVVKEISEINSAIIATGGGIVLRHENVDSLRMNGKLFFLDRPLEQLLPTCDRPLSSTKEALEKRYHERYDIYNGTADFVIQNDTSPLAAVEAIERNFYQ